jgi:hypothetical protein
MHCMQPTHFPSSATEGMPSSSLTIEPVGQNSPQMPQRLHQAWYNAMPNLRLDFGMGLAGDLAAGVGLVAAGLGAGACADGAGTGDTTGWVATLSAGTAGSA